jgi:hypothetical protein
MPELNAIRVQPAGHDLLAERRAFVRYPCDLETSCHPLTSGSGPEWAGQISDLSRGGVGLILNRRFELKTLLAIELHGRTGQFARRVFGRVVHVKRREDGSWLMGCALTTELSDEDLDALL